MSSGPESAARLSGKVLKQRVGDLFDRRGGLRLGAVRARFGHRPALPEDGAVGPALDPDLELGADHLPGPAAQPDAHAQADAAAVAARAATDTDGDRRPLAHAFADAARDMDGRDLLRLADRIYHGPPEPRELARH